MERTPTAPDERLNDLVDEISRLTGENYVTAMCQALEERRDRLVARQEAGRSPGIIRLRLEAEIPEDSLHRLVVPPSPNFDDLAQTDIEAA